MSKAKKMGMMCCVVFLVILLIGIFVSAKSHYEQKNYYADVAVVVSKVRTEASTENIKRIEYIIWVDYEIDGKSYKDVRVNQSLSKKTEVGDVLTLSYDTRNPTKLDIAADNAYIGIIVVLSVLSAAVLTIMGVIIFKR